MAPNICPGVTNTLQTISPSSSTQGINGLLVTFTLNPAPPPPPTNVNVSSVTLGTIVGTALSRPVSNTVSASFDIPGNTATGNVDVSVNYKGSYVAYKAAGFRVYSASAITARFSAYPTNGTAPLTVYFTDASISTVTNWFWDFGDNTTSTETNPIHTYYAAGNYTVTLTVWGQMGSNTSSRSSYISAVKPPQNGQYVVIDTGQTNCYNNTASIFPPATGQPFYGQDAQIQGHLPAYTNNGNGTITDLGTGLMWVQARGTNQVSWAEALSYATTCRVGGYSDWRMPTIKELYSLVQFIGADGIGFTSTTGYIPFIDTNNFGFAYGGNSTNVGDRVIDAQDWSATPYVSTTMNGDATIFGYNFTDGRLKGYPRYDPMNTSINQSNYVRYVRGNTSYGINNFIINGDGTISDKATLLMWSRNDNGTGINWSNALAWVQAQNASNYLGHADWRLPNAKELHTLVDYTRSPDTTASAAINPVFNCTAITNEAGQPDFPWYWSGTTLMTTPTSGEGVYICFGRAMGYMGGSWLDVHGAGAQRSDPKGGSLSSYNYASNGYYSALAPQGDAVRIYNYVRLVRDIPTNTAWRFALVGDTHIPMTTIPSEIASAVVGDDAKFLIVAGDIVEAGASCSPSTFASQLASWRTALAPVTAAGLGLYVIRGNHENDVPNGLPVWTNFFSGAYAMPGNGPSDEIGLTYSVSYSNALFLACDDYVNIHRVNQTWLNPQLATNRLPHVFVYGHEPAFNAFHTDCLDNYPTERNTFWNSLTAAGAKVYLCGHDHFFNLSRIDDGDGNPSNDLYQCIVGTGGTTNWPAQSYNYNGTNAPYLPVNVSSVTNTYGYLLVEMSGPGINDLGVTLTWKQRTYDSNTASFIYVAGSNGLVYTAVNRYADSVGDGIPDWWRATYFGGSGTATNAQSCASADPDRDGRSNLEEYLADTNPTNSNSRLAIEGIATTNSDVSLTWIGGNSSWQYVQSCAALAATNTPWAAVFTNTPYTAITNNLIRSEMTGTSNTFYRIEATR